MVKIFQFFGIGITSYNNLANLRKINYDLSDLYLSLEFMKATSTLNSKLTLNILSKSQSQLKQDLFVLNETNNKKRGYFVEFGATNGVDFSNTYLLEKEFSWKGILAEPAKSWEKELRENRPNSSIETSCVWKDSISRLVFNETSDPKLSTIDTFSFDDGHRYARKTGKKYEVQSISLLDLLRKHKAPIYIDYLSIDTEGSEYQILNSFDFNEYHIQIITVEHNHTSQRDLIFSLLSANGYKRKYDNISGFDDWYIKI